MNPVQIEIVNKIRRYFEPLKDQVRGRMICVCLSGGADSVSLLYLLKDITSEFEFSVSACHFNHMIRGEEADRDECFCKQLCNDSGITIYCGRDDVPAYAEYYGKTLEEAARECRYAFFQRVLSKNHIDFCATAHNMNDDAETLIMNLIRGSGSNGASAISPINDNILRPLLKVSRKEIEEYLSSIGAVFVNDSTNDSVEYTRNYIRHIVLPAMSKLNPDVVEALSRYTDSCRADRSYFDALVSDNIDAELTNLHKALRDRIILKKYKDFSGNILYRSAVDEIEKALVQGKRVILSINPKHEAVIRNGRVDFYNKTDSPVFEFEPICLNEGINNIFADRVTVIISDTVYKSDLFVNKIVISQLLSFDNISGELKARARREGDRITVFGVNKSVKKLFNERKIPKEYRDIIPIIYDEQGIIYIPFVGIADRAFPKDKNPAKSVTTVLNKIDKERWSSAYEK